ncbi:MAG: SET domain-containing protein [Desulfobacterales bacterium]|nr:MAG: SET domain-containing protein [Desulfobacterales bacterium]
MKRLILQESPSGKGVFAGEVIFTGEEILTFSGPLIRRRDMPAIRCQEEDYYLQVDDNVFLGPSGDIDDYVNHSCDPNSGVIIDGGSPRLIAIQTIRRGEEIRFDYSTTMYRPVLVMNCSCESAICRGTVVDFIYLPAKIQAKYIALGIVPDYITNRITGKTSQIHREYPAARLRGRRICC